MTTMSQQPAYDQLVEELRGAQLLRSCAAVLEWDEQTNLPPGGAEHRSNQLGLLAGLIHERATSPRIGDLLSQLEQNGNGSDPHEPAAVNVKEARRSYDRATRLPRQLVEELSRVVSLSQQAWITARKEADFTKFLPWLEKVVGLKREEAQALGYGDGIPYDALLDDYEPGATSADVEAVFTPLRDELVKLVAAIRDSGREPNISILSRRYPVDQQREFGLEAARQIGFNLDEGRLDTAAHPFCSGFGPGDCRLTTRYNEHHFPGAFFGTLHEAGHGIYEQGLDRSAYGTPIGDACSLGIHESQSLTWENLVGRSRAFWNYFFPKAQQRFPEALGDVSQEEFYWAVNDVRPSFIRVEADDVTYSLHIMLRFELERPLIAGDLQPADVPAVWNETFTRYLGITPPDDAQGCLQDIHWSAGLIGYFPTYALGKMYAAQFFAAAQKELGDLDEQFARGEFQPLRDWLRENIHRRGRQYRAGELVQVVTGQPLSHQPFVDKLHSKFDELYGL